jgi:hypothetical protein
MTWGWKVLWCLGAFSLLSSDISATLAQYAFRVQFKDKQGSLSLSNPLLFLSQRAIDRRNAQLVSLDSTDQPVVSAYINDVLSNTSGTFHSASKWMNSCVVLLTDSSQILNIQSKPYVADIKYVGYFFSGLHKPSNTTELPSGAKTTGSSGYYGGSYDQTLMVNGNYLHDRGYKGTGKLIAVLDEGFSGVNTIDVYSNLMTSGRLLDTHNFVFASNDVFSAYNHGTMCLSTIAADKQGTYVGSAPNAQYALYVTEYSFGDYPMELDDMAAAIERADSLGADIISSSLGYNLFSGSFPDLTNADIDGKTTVAAKAVNMASTKGMLCVITAGNEGGNSWNYILTPGDADSAITVGSVGSSYTPASSSGFGPNSSGRIKPDVCMLGDPAAIVNSSGTATQAGGTSYATPQLAGWAACLWQSSPSATATKLREAIRRSAHRYANPDNHIGYGVPDFYLASQFLGVTETPLPSNTNNWVTIAPNPIAKQLTCLFKMEIAEKVQLIITDAVGKEVYTTSADTKAGEQKLTLAIPVLSKGVYFLKAETSNKLKTVQFIQQ